MNKILNFLKNYRQFICSFIMLLFAFVSVISGIFAWFTVNQSTKSDNVTVDTNDENVHFRNLIEITRYYNSSIVSDTWYHCEDGDTNYYEYSLSTGYVYDDDSNLIPMTISSILPNEYIDITLWYYPDDECKNNTYNLCLVDLDDLNGKFELTDSQTSTSYSHSALGVFRVGEVDTDTHLVDDSNWKWLCTYNGNYLDDTTYSSVSFKSGSFSTESTTTIDNVSYYSTTFRIELNLTQYYDVLTKATTNALSELYVKIGGIRLIA